MGESDLRCPKCHSTKLHFEKNGYGYGNGCLGAICLGPFGLLCGGLGNDEIYANCLKCGKKFKTKKAICYEDEEAWECEHCGEQFESKKKCTKHERDCEEEDEEEERDFICPECGHDISVNIDKSDLEQGFLADCPTCKKEVTLTEEELEENVEVVEEEDWECEYCGNQFETEKKCTKHEKKCDEMKEWECEYCKKII
ncbi:MAG: CPXCG motif-containing cysteine-rich protein [Nanoarchaeota archaeon]|jgi:DNA-directed RNA polymerase subunit RPC12/RpoP|nr:CPXCG motif-containing cysteine-rich protein [Nanoarchaeota archaeon]